MKITTPNGFKCILYEESLDDPDVFLKLIELQKGQVQYLPDVMQSLLGNDAYSRIAEFVRDENGKSSIKRMIEEFYSVLKIAGEFKKK